MNNMIHKSAVEPGINEAKVKLLTLGFFYHRNKLDELRLGADEEMYHLVPSRLSLRRCRISWINFRLAPMRSARTPNMPI